MEPFIVPQSVSISIKRSLSVSSSFSVKRILYGDKKERLISVMASFCVNIRQSNFGWKWNERED